MAKAAEMNPAVAAAELGERAQKELAKKNQGLGGLKSVSRRGSMQLAKMLSDEDLRKIASGAANGGGKRKKIKSKKRTKRNKQKTKRRKNHTKKNRTRKRR